MSPGPVARFIEETTAWAREARRPDGRRVIDEPWVQLDLARARASVEVLELMTWRQAWHIDQGVLDAAESSTVKVFGSESFVQVYQLLLEVLGQPGYLKKGSPGAMLRGRIEMYYRTTLVLTFGGGVNEVQRDIIATAGLADAPRPPLRGALPMDFSFTEAQAAVADLSRKIFAERVTPAALKAVEAEPDWFFRKLWADLAAAGLLGDGHPRGPRRQRPRAAGAVRAPRRGRRGGGADPALADAGARRAAGRAARHARAEAAAPARRRRRRDPAHRGPRRGERRRAPAARDHGHARGRRLVAHRGQDLRPRRAPGHARAGAGAHAGRRGRPLPPRPAGAGVTLERETATTGEPQFRLTLDGARVARG